MALFTLVGGARHMGLMCAWLYGHGGPDLIDRAASTTLDFDLARDSLCGCFEQ
jgi:hypothetical protein